MQLFEDQQSHHESNRFSGGALILIIVLPIGVLIELPVYGSGEAAKRLPLIEHARNVGHQKDSLSWIRGRSWFHRFDKGFGWFCTYFVKI